MRRFLIAAIAALIVLSLNAAASAAPALGLSPAHPHDFSPPYLVSARTHEDVHGVNAISCVTIDSCAAVDRAGNALIYNGRRWTKTAVDAKHSLIAISGFYGKDPSPGGVRAPNYVAIDAADRTAFWNGQAWATTTTTGTFAPTSISCVGNIDDAQQYVCDAGDTKGNLWYFSDANPAWQEVPRVTTTPITSVSCYVRGICKTVDATGDVTGDTPSPLDLDGHNHLTSIFCVVSDIGLNSDLCAAVDNRGNAFTFAQNRWGVATATKGGDLVSVACSPETTFCAAVDAGGFVVLFDATDHTWSPPVRVDDKGHLTSITCPSASFCQASDDQGNIVQIAPVHAGVPVN